MLDTSPGRRCCHKHKGLWFKSRISRCFPFEPEILLWWCMDDSPTKNIYSPEENNDIKIDLLPSVELEIENRKMKAIGYVL